MKTITTLALRGLLPTDSLGTLMQLAADSPEVAAMSVKDVLAAAVAAEPGRRSRGPGLVQEAVANSASLPSSKRAPKVVDTRTRAGRNNYRSDVLMAVNAVDGEVTATAIRARVGGTKLQARAALNHLIESGHIQFSGKARGTKYSAA